MAADPPARRVRPLLLLLGSGAAVLVLGAVGLWRAAEGAESAARGLRQTAAQRAARELQGELVRPETLAGVDAERRFTLRGGEVVLPALLAVEPAPAPPPLPPSIHDLLRRARRAEFVDGDALRAAELLRAALADGGTPGYARPPLALALAWNAVRRGDDAAAATLLDELSARDEDVAAAAHAPALLLLHAASERSLPVWSDACLARLDDEAAAGVLARLAERVDGDALSPLRASCERRRVARQVVREARVLAPMLRAHSEPWAGAHQGQVALWRPLDGSDGDGDGALAPAATLVSAARRDELASLDLELGFGDGAPAGAVPVVAGALAVVPRTAPAGARPWLLFAVLLATGAVFATSLVASVRALRREAAAQAARADFLTSVTHELKTPLASLRLLSEMLHDGLVDDAASVRDYHRLIHGESLRLGALIDNVLDLGRIERGERAYDRQPLDLGALVAEVAALVRPLAEREGTAVEVRPPAHPVSARADRGALTQALLNVLDNARKYGGAGGRIEVSVASDPLGARLVVRDRGPGVDAGEREAIFARFARGAAHRAGQVPGVGLGLYLSRAILRAHGGDLTCAPPADGGPGTEFTFTLPAPEADA